MSRTAFENQYILDRFVPQTVTPIAEVTNRLHGSILNVPPRSSANKDNWWQSVNAAVTLRHLRKGETVTYWSGHRGADPCALTNYPSCQCRNEKSRLALAQVWRPAAGDFGIGSVLKPNFNSSYVSRRSSIIHCEIMYDVAPHVTEQFPSAADIPTASLD